MSTSAARVPPAVEYPDSDGQPMAETEIHGDELIALRASLKERFRDRDDVYVGSNMFFYFEEGDPSACFSPDVFVVVGVPKRPKRRTYKLWVEGRAPAFVVEISSRKTWLEDAGNKKTICERLGTHEYVLFDPEADYLDPPLQMFRLQDGSYVRVAPDSQGRLWSEALELRLELDDQLRLHLFDLAAGAHVPRPEELAAMHRHAQERARAAEAELERLRAELERLRGKG